MAQKSKQVGSFREAVQDIPDGATIGFGGFAMPGVPFNLIKALHDHGAKQLTLVANTTGGAQQPRMPDIGMLVENGQVKKVVCAFTASTRPTDVIPFTKYYESGEVDAELVPQGTLAERMRAAGAGIPAFYTPTAVGTELEFHRSQRNFCPVMATAARIAIAEVDEDILPAGAIDPDQVHTPGIFIHRVVRVPPAPEGIWPQRRQERRR